MVDDNNNKYLCQWCVRMADREYLVCLYISQGGSKSSLLRLALLLPNRWSEKYQHWIRVMCGSRLAAVVKHMAYQCPVSLRTKRATCDGWCLII